MNLEPLKAEIRRLQGALLEYDRALGWRDCPWREQFAKARQRDLKILSILYRQLIYGHAGKTVA